MSPTNSNSKGPIEELAQLKGKKSLWAACTTSPWFQSIGAVPVNAAAADLYQTIKTGVASGSFVYDSIYCNYSSMRWKTTALRSAWARAITMCSASTRTCGRVWTRRPSSSSRSAPTRPWPSSRTGSRARWTAGNRRCLTTALRFHPFSDEAKAEWAETALGYQDTLQTWIDEVTALGYDGAGIMSAYLQAGEELGYEWHFDTTPYIQ